MGRVNAPSDLPEGTHEGEGYCQRQNTDSSPDPHASSGVVVSHEPCHLLVGEGFSC
jgi:hypothetical protein